MYCGVEYYRVVLCGVGFSNVWRVVVSLLYVVMKKIELGSPVRGNYLLSIKLLRLLSLKLLMFGI